MTNPIKPINIPHEPSCAVVTNRNGAYMPECNCIVERRRTERIIDHERSRREAAEALLEFIMINEIQRCYCDRYHEDTACPHCQYQELQRNIAEATKI